jgi:hypothetical protein
MVADSPPSLAEALWQSNTLPKINNDVFINFIIILPLFVFKKRYFLFSSKNLKTNFLKKFINKNILFS